MEARWNYLPGFFMLGAAPKKSKGAFQTISKKDGVFLSCF
jgi:hypothetical protein